MPEQAKVRFLFPVDRFTCKLVNVTEHRRTVERVRHNVLAVHDFLDGAPDAAQHCDFTDVMNERVARRHGAEQGLQFDVLNQGVRVGKATAV